MWASEGRQHKLNSQMKSCSRLSFQYYMMTLPLFCKFGMMTLLLLHEEIGAPYMLILSLWFLVSSSFFRSSSFLPLLWQLRRGKTQLHESEVWWDIFQMAWSSKHTHNPMPGMEFAWNSLSITRRGWEAFKYYRKVRKSNVVDVVHCLLDPGLVVEKQFWLS